MMAARAPPLTTNSGPGAARLVTAHQSSNYADLMRRLKQCGPHSASAIASPRMSSCGRRSGAGNPNRLMHGETDVHFAGNSLRSRPLTPGVSVDVERGRLSQAPRSFVETAEQQTVSP